ncbi:MAG TPA: flagellar biosynthetic protein FliR [Allosphingosinicella sp.]|nr:flagellar biosynthetic protein FliR [Allosphingosinicella sp.]
MAGGAPIGWAVSALLLSLRVAPVFAFAPPFTLVRMPRTFRMLLSLGIAACLVAAHPAAAALTDAGAGALVLIGVKELLLGTIFLVAFQLTFAALQVAGRAIDIQAGFGLSLLIDPTTRGSVPLVGTLFVYAAAAVFFAEGGHFELLRLFAASLDAAPLGGWQLPASPGHLIAFISAVFVTAFGVAAGAMLALFVADLAIAMLSRTVPQMNVLILGFQVKTIVLLLVLPITFGTAGALLARMTRLTLEALPGML